MHSRNDFEVRLPSEQAATLALRMLDGLLGSCLQVSPKKRLIVVHCGDLVDGVHHNSLQVMNEVEDQAEAFMDLMLPIVSELTASTACWERVQVTPEWITPTQIYRDLGATEFGQNLTLSVDGVLHTFFHHGRAGGRPWTSSSAGLAAEVMLDFAQAGLPLPNFIWTGHTHRADDSGSKFRDTRAISLPAWQLKTSFAHRVSAATVRSDIGGYIVVDGIVDDSRSRYRGQPDQRRIICV